MSILSLITSAKDKRLLFGPSAQREGSNFVYYKGGGYKLYKDQRGCYLTPGLALYLFLITRKWPTISNGDRLSAGTE